MSNAAANKTKEILASLDEERATLRAFVVLLEDEQRTLLGHNTDELMAQAETKIQLANKVSALAKARLQNLPAATPDMATWLKQHAPQGLPAWNEIRQLAAKLQELNQLNGELIQIKQRYNQQAINALFGAVQSTAGLYGADGQTNTPSASRPLGSV